MRRWYRPIWTALAMGLCCSASAAPDAPSRFALLVGVGEYDHLPKLRGPANDVIVMRDVLRRHFGVARGAMRQLVDHQATGEAIRAALRDLEGRLGVGDEVFFYFSGHGSQVLDRSGDEPDRRDETLVPVDSGRGRHANTDLTDDELASWLKAVERRGARATLIFDSCHAGTAHKGRDVREVPYDPNPPRRVTPHADGDATGLVPRLTGTVLLAAARAHEPARERARGGRVYGVLTWHLAHVLQGASPPQSWRALARQLRARFSAEGEQQHVQLVGPGDGPLPNAHVAQPQGHAVNRVGHDLRLALGAVHGIAPGSTFSVRGDADGQVIGTVTTVDPTTSVLTANGPPPSGVLRAFEATRVLPQGPFVVRLGAGVSATIAKQLAAEFPEMVLHSVVAQRAHLAIDVAHGHATVGVPDTSTPTRVVASAEAISRALRGWRRWVAVEHLSRTHRGLAVSVQIEDVDGRAIDRPLHPGEPVWVGVENLRAKPAFLNLVYLGGDGGVTLLHPRDGAQEPLAALAKWRSTRLRAHLPNDVNAATDRVKVIVTRQFVDLWPLRQGAPKAGTPVDPLTRLLRDTMQGVRSKSGAQPDAWSADTLVIEVERPKRR